MVKKKAVKAPKKAVKKPSKKPKKPKKPRKPTKVAQLTQLKKDIQREREHTAHEISVMQEHLHDLVTSDDLQQIYKEIEELREYSGAENRLEQMESYVKEVKNTLQEIDAALAKFGSGQREPEGFLAGIQERILKLEKVQEEAVSHLALQIKELDERLPRSPSTHDIQKSFHLLEKRLSSLESTVKNEDLVRMRTDINALLEAVPHTIKEHLEDARELSSRATTVEKRFSEIDAYTLELAEYIKTHLSHMTDDDIKDHLLSHNTSPDDIDAALKHARKNQ